MKVVIERKGKGEKSFLLPTNNFIIKHLLEKYLGRGFDKKFFKSALDEFKSSSKQHGSFTFIEVISKDGDKIKIVI